MGRKGFVAEWLGRGLQNLLQRFESARNLGLKADRMEMLPFCPLFFYGVRTYSNCIKPEHVRMGQISQNSERHPVNRLAHFLRKWGGRYTQKRKVAYV